MSLRLFLNARVFFAVTTISALLANAAIPKANSAAPQGGVFNYNLGIEPPTLHPIMSTDVPAREVHRFAMATLAYNDIQTWEFAPYLASKWETSKDGKVFTFYINPKAKFSDGKPVTAEDVKFSFDAVKEPKYKAMHLIPYYEGIDKIEVIDPTTVRFTMKNTYFQNFSVVATTDIIPKHVYSDVAKSLKMTKTFVGAGPYKIEKWDKGQLIILSKVDNWWGSEIDSLKGFYNFAKINFRFFKEETIALERLKKGDVDFLDYTSITPEAFEKKTVGAPWGTTALKMKAENDSPRGFSFIGFNLQKEIFKSKNLRLALAHLFNREEIIKKFLYGYSLPAAGPEFYKSQYASPNVKPLSFNPKLAQELLAKDGWKDSDSNGVLDKVIDGKKTEFKFSLMYANKDVEKWFTIYKEDLKKAGIELELKLMEWNSFLKLLDEGSFDTIAMSWGSSDPEWDPKQIWHSSGAVVGGSNFIHYKNPEVDKLIDSGREMVDKKRRIAAFQKVYEIIANDTPYIFMFNRRYDYYVYTSKMQRPVDTFKYNIGFRTWWVTK